MKFFTSITFTSALGVSLARPAIDRSLKSRQAARCPIEISTNLISPNLIIPISADDPDAAFGTSYFGRVSPAESTLFHFTVPADVADQTCQLYFLLPSEEDLTVSSFEMSGLGPLNIMQMAEQATEQTTWNGRGATIGDWIELNVLPGNNYPLSNVPCGSLIPEGAEYGEITYQMASPQSKNLEWFENVGVPPIGLYIVAC